MAKSKKDTKKKEDSSKKQNKKKPVEKKKTSSKAKGKATPKKVKLPEVKSMEGFAPALKIVGIVVLIIGTIALIDLGVQYLNNHYSVAVVEGVRIPRRVWHQRLETAYGPSVASQLIEEQIVKNEAKIAGVSVAEEAIDEEIERIVESIGGQEMFEDALEANNISLQELRDQIKTDLLATEILAPELEYSEEDVKEFFNMYSDVIFPEESAALEEGELLDFEQNRERTEEIFIQQEVQSKKSVWLLEKRNEYMIQDNSTSRPRYGFLTITTNIINNLLEGNNQVEFELNGIEGIEIE